MSDIAIKVENLSKLYKLGAIGTGSIASDLTRWWAGVRGKEDPFAQVAIANDRSKKATSDYVWSLKDIDFEIKKGDAVGIIGRNGAGKSTLLKILSRVTTPTTGSVRINGRVASLLEVGTGFSPDLTGRENIYMNGSILGMSRREITSKIEEIIDFSGVAGYIDTPVKRYSSGMYVRLAFAVAAHLDPEIMIVDEVLAVGDAEFQKKCLGKMQDVNNQEGRTVLFVSHNIPSIKSLCKSGIYMQNGSLVNKGEINEIVNLYNKEFEDNQDFVAFYKNPKVSEVSFDIIEASISNGNALPQISYTTKDTMYVTVVYRLNKKLKGGLINFSVETSQQIVFQSFDTDLDKSRLGEREVGTYRTVVKIPALTLKPGKYALTFNTGIANTETHLRLEKCLVFAVQLDDEDETFISYAERRPGVIAMPLNWNTEKLDKE